MKGIYDILQDAGVTLPENFDKGAFEKSFNGNYKSVEEVKRKEESITALTEQLNTAKAGLEKFKDVNVEELNGKIATLAADIEAKEKAHAEKVSNMEFDYLLSGAISKAKGKNTKAIKALLDVDALKSSQNRDADITTAIESLKKDNDYLFETEEKPPKYAGGAGTGASAGLQTDPAFEAFKKAAGIKEKGN